jgi:hypothetical protein
LIFFLTGKDGGWIVTEGAVEFCIVTFPWKFFSEIGSGLGIDELMVGAVDE